MEIIRSQVPDLNVVVPPSLSDVAVGPLKLRNIAVDGLARAIVAATDNRIEDVYDGDAYLTFAGNPHVAQQQSVCRILSLRAYLDGRPANEVDRSINDLTEVVTLACRHLEEARNGVQVKTPQFSVHPATKLLIAVGSPEAVNIVEEVVNAVSGVPTAQPGSMGAMFGSGPAIPGMGADPHGGFAVPGMRGSGGAGLPAAGQPKGRAPGNRGAVVPGIEGH